MLFYGGKFVWNVPSNLSEDLEIRKFIEDKSGANEPKPKILIYSTIQSKVAQQNKIWHEQQEIRSRWYAIGVRDKPAKMQSKSHRNPVEHGDIDTNLVYLNKTKASLRIWFHCTKRRKIDIEFVKLIQLYHF
jgi:hypothetical protein